MLAIAQFLAVVTTGLFAGAAIYINLVEHPARMGCSTEVAATVWAPSYKRATVMQASLAIIGFLSGSVAWLLGAGLMWLVASLVILAVVPVTLLVIFPTNNKLLAPGRDLGSSETRALLVKWGQLHAIRSVLSLVATLMFVWLLVVA
jgi:anthrone oxygenase-like protein